MATAMTTSLLAEAVMFVLSCLEVLSYPFEMGTLTEWYWVARFIAFCVSLVVTFYLIVQLENNRS